MIEIILDEKLFMMLCCITSSLTDNRVVVYNNKRRKYSLSKKETNVDSVNLVIALTMILNLHFL